MTTVSLLANINYNWQMKVTVYDKKILARLHDEMQQKDSHLMSILYRHFFQLGMNHCQFLSNQIIDNNLVTCETAETADIMYHRMSSDEVIETCSVVHIHGMHK